MNFIIEPMQLTDWETVSSIYLEGIATGNATFETNAPNWDTWNAGHLQHSRLVAKFAESADKETGEILGWAALSPVSGRCVYGGVAEVSVYVGAKGRGKGIGSKLLEELIQSSEENGMWTLQAGIFPKNIASINLHLRYGFREIGRRERIGKLAGIWRDTILLERRSRIIGIE